MITDRAHAVRWAKRVIRSLGNEIIYSRWHWTTNAHTTACGRLISVISDTPHTLPEADDDSARVDCAQCIKQMQPNAELCGSPERSVGESERAPG